MLTDYAENAFLDLALVGTAFSSPATVYMALMSGSGTDSTDGGEKSGGSYARQAITFGAPSAGTITNTNGLRFTGLTTGFVTITGWSIYDAATGGNRLAYGNLTTGQSHQANEDFRFEVGSISLTVANISTRFSTYLANAALNHLFRNVAFTSPSASLYLSLHTGVPGTTGANEVSGGNYSRQSIAFVDTATAGWVDSDGFSGFQCSGASWGHLAYWGIWDASTSGNFLGSGTVNGGTGQSVSDGDYFYFSDAAMDVRMD